MSFLKIKKPIINKDIEVHDERYGTRGLFSQKVKAFGTTMKRSEADKIYDYNENNRQQGVNLDNRRAANQKIVIDKNGVVDFKKTLKIRLPQSWKSILGIK